MRRHSLRAAIVLLAAAMVVLWAALSHTSPSSAESSAPKVGGEGRTAAEPPDRRAPAGGHHMPDAAPPVTVLPPAASVYDSVPAESLTHWVAKVNGDPVAVRLFERRLARNRSQAFHHFRPKHGARTGADFWTTAHDGTTPAEWLKQSTLESCVKIKVELRLAQESGVIGDTSYAAFLKALDNENERRRAALAAGEPIYGPQQYKEDQFFLYIMNNMRIALLKHLGKTRFQASEETLRQDYESMKDERFDKGHRVKVWAVGAFCRKSTILYRGVPAARYK